MWLDSFAFTSRGGRSYNQDAVGTTEHPNGSVFVVADGLGGHLHGEMASQCAVDTLLGAEIEPGEDSVSWLETRIKCAHEEILSLQKQHGSMKTTVTALLIQGQNASWAHVGDTRLYYLRNKRIASFTEDHSVAYKKYLAGEITRAQIGADEDQPSLLRALGNPTRYQPVCCTAENPIQPSDGFLICSDGVWGYLQDEEVLVDFLKADSAQNWAELLLLRIMERIPEDNDNLSIITVMVNGEE